MTTTAVVSAAATTVTPSVVTSDEVTSRIGVDSRRKLQAEVSSDILLAMRILKQCSIHFSRLTMICREFWSYWARDHQHLPIRLSHSPLSQPNQSRNLFPTISEVLVSHHLFLNPRLALKHILLILLVLYQSPIRWEVLGCLFYLVVKATFTICKLDHLLNSCEFFLFLAQLCSVALQWHDVSSSAPISSPVQKSRKRRITAWTKMEVILRRYITDFHFLSNTRQPLMIFKLFFLVVPKERCHWALLRVTHWDNGVQVE